MLPDAAWASKRAKSVVSLCDGRSPRNKGWTADSQQTNEADRGSTGFQSRQVMDAVFEGKCIMIVTTRKGTRTPGFQEKPTVASVCLRLGRPRPAVAYRCSELDWSPPPSDPPCSVCTRGARKSPVHATIVFSACVVAGRAPIQAERESAHFLPFAFSALASRGSGRRRSLRLCPAVRRKRQPHLPLSDLCAILQMASHPCSRTCRKPRFQT
jgi:hypothetical protein